MEILANGGTAQSVLFCLMGVLSIVGCLLYLYCYFVLHPTPNRSLARNMIALIAATEAISIFGNVVGIIYMNVGSPYKYSDYAFPEEYPETCRANETPPPSDQFCQIQAFVTNFFSISSFIYNSGLAIMMLHITVTNKADRRVFWAVNTAAWLIPAVVTVSVACKGLYGFSICTTGGWCWLKQIDDFNHTKRAEEAIWQSFAGKFWEISTEIILIASYIGVKLALMYKQRQLRRRGFSQEVVHTLQAVESLYLRLLLIPVSFFFCYIFGTIRSYVLLYNPNIDWPTTVLNCLAFLHGIGNNAPGFCNFVIFVLLQKRVRDELMRDLAMKLRSFFRFCSFAVTYKVNDPPGENLMPKVARDMKSSNRHDLQPSSSSAKLLDSRHTREVEFFDSDEDDNHYHHRLQHDNYATEDQSEPSVYESINIHLRRP
ncbi:uncharacterized protein LOC134846250 [Symsagittifera roscoffensis]|uniref:uncharacterized protein LOC134846250 n=1 Tax=Symsagittifera roscoffensis TaxID=84072 RepID=UPI00307B549B